MLFSYIHPQISAHFSKLAWAKIKNMDSSPKSECFLNCFSFRKTTPKNYKNAYLVSSFHSVISRSIRKGAEMKYGLNIITEENTG